MSEVPDDEGTGTKLVPSLDAAQQALIPTCLADIIRAHRDEASLDLTSELQLADLTGPVTALKVRGEFTDWRLVTLETVQ